MAWLSYLFLRIIHAIYFLLNVASTFRHHFARSPLPLTATRRQVPKHLALLLATDDSIALAIHEERVLENVKDILKWCRAAKVERLTIYDHQGILSRCSFQLRAHLLAGTRALAGCESNSEPEYPLTPPLSDESNVNSRSLSLRDLPPNLHTSTIYSTPEQYKKKRHNGRSVQKRRNQQKHQPDDLSPFVVHILSRESGKPALVEVVDFLARAEQSQSEPNKPTYQLSVDNLKTVMEGDHGFPPPDLMVVHYAKRCRHPKRVLELHGFPPWQISLTEIHYTSYPTSWRPWMWRSSATAYIPFTAVDLCRALDEYAGADMRLGR